MIFDCDGVLVDTERLSVDVEARVLTELGWPMTAGEVVRRWLGRSSAAQLAEVAERLGSAAADDYDRRTTAEIHEVFESELSEIDGISRLLDDLDAAGIDLCVASSGTHERMRRTLGLTGLWDRLDGRIFSATEVEHGKPAPDLFLYAAAQRGVDPRQAVVIEDSVFGVRAGVAAGMRVLGYAGGLTPETELADAGADTFEHMRDVAGLLQQGVEPIKNSHGRTSCRAPLEAS